MDKQYHLTYTTDSWVQRRISELLFYFFMAFLVWLSQGSVWYTFLFGTLALLAIAGRLKYYYDNYHVSFINKRELLEFVKGLDE